MKLDDFPLAGEQAPLSLPFRGRIFQVLDSLDFGDAVCNHAINLDRMLRSMGIETRIHTTWFHESMGSYRSPLQELQPNDDDIVIMHFAGFSDHAWPFFKALRCTRICLYHNVTPHQFFPKGSRLHEFCLKGRAQLPELIEHCHYLWAVSEYNLQELIDLGADRSKCAVVPIVVEAPKPATPPQTAIETGTWLFVGRIAGNKGHVNLVRLFAEVRNKDRANARKLYLVGNFDPNESIYLDLRREVARLGLDDDVVVTGKLPDAEWEAYFCRSSIYVSMSEHEGFGVPLVEATHRGVPVVALARSAIGETMGKAPGLVESAEDLGQEIVRVLSDAAYRKDLLAQQAANARRFTAAAVQRCLRSALSLAIPEPGRFKTVSIVICTYNRCDLLARCLDYLQYQTNKNFEIVVVNGPSTDATEQVLQQYVGRIKVTRNAERNLSISRNLGIEIASGDLVAFIDDDALPFDDWVDTLLREFNRRPLTLAGLGGPAYFAGTLEFQDQDIGINRFAETRKDIAPSEVGSDGLERSLLGTNTCFRADILRAVSGFDEQFDYFLDESELCFRLQMRHFIVAYCPDLYLRHEFAQSHNRAGRYKFNWFTICKNIAYFVAAYSGLRGAELKRYLERRMEDERVSWVRSGLVAGEVSQAEFDDAVKAIFAGVEQGLVDARGFPRTRALRQTPGSAMLRFCAGESVAASDRKPLHICIVSQEFPPFTGSGGIGTLYYNLASEFLLMGHRVSVLTPSTEDSVYQRGRFVLRRVYKRPLVENTVDAPGFVNNMNWSASALHAVAALHATDPIDVIDSALWDVEALMTALAPRGKRPPVVVRLVTPFPVVARMNGWTVPEHEYGLFCEAERTLVEHADAVVPISESIAATIEQEHKLVRDARWVLSHCGIAYWPSFDSRLGYSELGVINGKPFELPADSKLVLFVGRLEGRKGVPELIKAAAAFLGGDRDAHLVLAGRDTDDFQKKASRELPAPLLERVHFLGQVDDATRDKLLHAAFCLVFPSRYESFGLVPLEAFVHGVPVVAARAGAIPEVVADGKCGLLFRAGDADDLAGKVQRLLSEAGLRDSLSAGARQQIRHFSSRRSAIRAIELYRSLSHHPDSALVETVG